MLLRLVVAELAGVVLLRLVVAEPAGVVLLRLVVAELAGVVLLRLVVAELADVVLPRLVVPELARVQRQAVAACASGARTCGVRRYPWQRIAPPAADPGGYPGFPARGRGALSTRRGCWGHDEP